FLNRFDPNLLEHRPLIVAGVKHVRQANLLSYSDFEVSYDAGPWPSAVPPNVAELLPGPTSGMPCGDSFDPSPARLPQTVQNRYKVVWGQNGEPTSAPHFSEGPPGADCRPTQHYTTGTLHSRATEQTIEGLSNYAAGGNHEFERCARGGGAPECHLCVGRGRR